MRIVKNGDVHVSAPIGMPKKEVERFIEEHRDWITEARKKTYESQKRRADFYNQLPLKTREQADDALQRLNPHCNCVTSTPLNNLKNSLIFK